MSYAIADVFYTIQGEGAHAGTAAQFIRFAGCNLWSGRAPDRERDAARNDARCPRFCDTDFIARSSVNLDELLERCEAPESVPLVVLTGGGPLLQLDAELAAGLRRRFPLTTIAVETNGSRAVPDFVDWICVSPKQPVALLEQRTGDELKVVMPAYDPGDYADVALNFDHLWVSAEAMPTAVGESLVVRDNLQRAARWCLRNPLWRVSLQGHKFMGVP